ncbi:nitrate- and nitrite sensing domain-containing protein [Streptomyces sp. TR06-5]|uniref:sensor histidine kinase n=1 Tax=Streptomyces sp. TR06-5 TaxID=3385976 RepID=UPI0039A33E9B
MQGRFKRDGSAAGDPELRGVTDRGSSPRRGRESSSTAAVQDSETTETLSGGRQAGDGKAGSRPKGPSGPGSRMALRNWHISTRLVSLLALPVVAATALGGLRIQDSRDNVEQLDNMRLLTEMTEHATELAAALQEERDKSAGPLVSTGNEKDDSVVATREATDRAREAFTDATGDLDPNDERLAGVKSTVYVISRQLEELRSIRTGAYENPKYASQTVDRYSRLINSLLSLSQDMAQATSNPDMIQSTRALASFSSAKEYASIQRAIISAGLAHKGGPDLSENDRLYAKSALDSEDANLRSFEAIYGSEGARELLDQLDGSTINTAAETYANRVLSSETGIKQRPRSYLDWYDQDTNKIEEMEKIEYSLLDEMEQRARTLRAQAQTDAWVNGVLILLVLGISLVGAFVVARSMIRSLRRLQDTAQDVARRRLPELVKQMSEADPQDVDTSVDSVGVHSRDEIGKVASAFDDVHREAVRLAGEQALLRGNVNAMFTNLSRRSQGLIQRQLSLISELESREADPDQLSSLFKLDHLATRMRRNGENLLVLAGEEPGRRWTRPVPLVDVLRAAASEVEQYERIELNAVPSTEVAGRVVNDLVHLLAELLENATSFSSPQTKVKVTGHALPDGRVLVEIHDTGIGLSPEDLSAINDRLANPPTVDVSVSRRMGLFVVGRLSLRHGIRIQLRPSDSGGTTALVMLPVDIAQGGAGAKGKAGGRPSGGGKGGGLAAALQREPRGTSDASHPAAAQNRPGAPAPDRSQVGGGAPRPALSGGNDTAPGTPGPAGLPTRPGAGAPAGAGPGAGPAGAAGTTGHRPTAPQQHTSGGLPVRGGSAGGEFPGAGSQGAGASSLPQGGPGDTAQFERPDFDTPPPGAPVAGGPEAGRPSWAAPDAPRGHDEPRPSGEFPTGPLPAGGAPGPGQQDTGRFPAAPSDRGDLAAPTGPSPAADRTPIFESMESNWFQGPAAGRGSAAPQAAQQPGPYSGDAQASSPGMSPQQPAQNSTGGPRETVDAQWGTSPNDDRWRRAEQLRQPSAGGVTTSGLPRRVPRANLVAGTAQQQSTAQSGPQVSRAPDDVRGRLTNLRRGIQQGRQAGSESRGLGPTHQQER